jgi:Zn-dependent protease
MENELAGVFTVIIVLMSVVVHEVAHGYAALTYGDKTALMAGRLTLNPLKHLDPIGSVILPLLLIISHAPFPFGWARPVPYNPNNLNNQKWGVPAVSAAGIGANLGLAIVFALVLRVSLMVGVTSAPFLTVVSLIVLANISLALFNLLPVPPLDGSRILFGLLPLRYRSLEARFEVYALPAVLILMVVLWKFDFISPAIRFLYTLFTGIAL